MSLEIETRFPEATEEVWRAAAEKALKGADFAETLRSRTADHLAIEPLYQRLANRAPIARPNDAAPWTLVQKMDHVDPEAANKQALEDLSNGATGLAMVFADAHGAHGYGLVAEPETFDKALEGIDLNAIHLRLEPGPRGKKTQELFSDYCKRAHYSPDLLDVRFGLDAIGAVAACGTMRWPFKDIQQHMRNEFQGRVSEGFKGPFFEADARVFHDAGATPAEELAIVLANAVAFFRTLGELGNLEAARDAIGFTLSVDEDQFISIAKLRALRLLWNNVQEASGLSAKPAKLHAETSVRMLSAQDPDTNLLRMATAAFASGVGGADSLTVVPHSAANGLPDSFARRMARNIQSIFIEESNLHRVVDPAAGSGAFESLTDQLAKEAWTKFQEIERAGGVDQALTAGLIHGWIKEANAARQERVRSGEKSIIGVNLHRFNGAQSHTLNVERREDLIITKGALTIDRLLMQSDEALAGDTL